MLSSIRLDGGTECIVVDGAMDSAMFSKYIAQILCPTLRPNDIVIMDNLSAHKNPDVADISKNAVLSFCICPRIAPI